MYAQMESPMYVDRNIVGRETVEGIRGFLSLTDTCIME